MADLLTPEQRREATRRKQARQRDITLMAEGAARRREALERWEVYNLDAKVTIGTHPISGVGGYLLETALQTAFHGGDDGNRYAEFRSCLDTSFHYQRRIVAALDLLRDRQPTVSGGWADHPVVAEWLNSSGWHTRVAEASSLALALGCCLVRVSANPAPHLETVYPQSVDVLPMYGLDEPGCLVEYGERSVVVWDIREPGNPIAFKSRSLTAAAWENAPGVCEWYLSGLDYPLWVDGKPALPAVIYSDPRSMSSTLLPLSRGLHTITLAEILDSTQMRHALRDAPVSQLVTLTQMAVTSTSTSAPAPSQVLSLVGWSAGDEAMIKVGAAEDVAKLRLDQAGRIQTATYEYIGSAAIEVSRSPESGIALSLRQAEKDGEFERQKARWAPVDLEMLTMVATLLIGSEAVASLGPPSITYERTQTPEEKRAVDESRQKRIASVQVDKLQALIHDITAGVVARDVGRWMLTNAYPFTPDEVDALLVIIPEAAAVPQEQEAPLLPHEQRGVATREMADIAAAAMLQARSDPSVTPGDLRWGADIRGRKPISMGRIAELLAWFTAHPGEEDTLPGQLRGGVPGKTWAEAAISGMDADLDGDGQPDGKPVSIA